MYADTFATVGRAIVSIAFALSMSTAEAEPSTRPPGSSAPIPSTNCAQLQRTINVLERQANFPGVRKVLEQGKAAGCKLKIYRAANVNRPPKK